MRDNRSKRGQALIMITMSLIAMCGVMGLAVDLGWGYFVKKAAQRAADAAALAAVDQALDTVGQAGQFVCGTGITCPVSANCTAPNNPPQNEVDAGCLYAKQNGFSPSDPNNPNHSVQNVIIDGNTKNPPTAGIKVDYWVTARVTQMVPQLFSAVLRFPMSQSSARATAAVVDSPVGGSIYLINRENDKNVVKDPAGTDLDMQGGGSITATAGVYMASTGGCGGGACAGLLGGSSSVTAAYVGMRGTGAINNPGNVTPSPTNGLPDQASFQDPMKKKGQPPPPTLLDAPAQGVTGGSISSSGNNCATLNPASYYAVDNKGKATLNPINISGCVNFSAGSNGFGNYVFYGGVNLNSPGSVITMAPGIYIFAGVNGSQNSVFQMANGVTLQDQTPLQGGNVVANTDAGELLVFTDGNYVGGTATNPRALAIPPALIGEQSNFVFGNVNLQMGNTSQSTLILHGLNADSSSLPSELKPFAPTIMWTDQQNSPIKYDANGNIVDSTSCGGGGTLATPCANTSSEVTMTGKDPSTLFQMQATPGLHLYGVFYQPRGDTLDMQGSGSVTTPMQIITGTLRMGGSPTVLQPLNGIPLIVKMVALIE